MSIQEVKLESVQEVVVPVVVQAPDHQLYSAVPSTSGSGQAGSDPQPEEGYYNFSLELLKSFSERFKGQSSINRWIIDVTIEIFLFPVNNFLLFYN